MTATVMPKAAKVHYPHIALARGLSIVLVAFGHSALADMHSSTDILGVVRMPFFFLLAGLFFSVQRDIGQYGRQKSIALLTPYFFVLTAIGLKQWWAGADFAVYMAGVLYANGQTIAWTPLWFLPHLFLLYSAAALLLGTSGFATLTCTRQCIIALLWLLLAGAAMNHLQPLLQANAGLLHTGLPWGADFLPLSLGYFMLGFSLKKQFTEARFSLVRLLGFGVSFIVLVYLSEAQVDFNLRLYTPSVLLPLIILPGCFMLLHCALLFSQVPLLRQGLILCGKYSLYILIFHVFIQQVLQRITDTDGVLPHVGILLLSILLSVAAGWVIRRISMLRQCFEPGMARAKATS